MDCHPSNRGRVDARMGMALEVTVDWEGQGHRESTEDTEESLSILSGRIIASALKVHTKLGPGLLESAYEACLCRQLSLDGIKFRRQVEMPLHYEGLNLDCGYRIDLLVDDTVVVEIKATTSLTPTHRSQLLTYLRLSGHRLGLLLNFNVPRLRDGIARVIN